MYLQQFPDSAVAINLKACNHFRLYNGKAAEAELKALQDMASPSFQFAQDLIKHNLVRKVNVKQPLAACVVQRMAYLCFYLFEQVVFRGGEGALQVLPRLIDVIPEARLNLVIYYLRQGETRHQMRD